MIARSLGIAVALLVASPLAAQTSRPPGAPPTTIPGDVVVTGTTERQSDWKRADGQHVVVYSTGSAGELIRVTKTLERLHALMTRIYRRSADADQTLPLRVTLIDSPSRFRSLGFASPVPDVSFAARFASQASYDPRADGPALTVVRSDRMIDLNTNRRFNNDCDDLRVDGADRSCGEIVPVHDPLARAWEAELYSAFAQHFLRTYVPAAYPRWYLDGVGALFSTVAIRPDGRLDYAKAPVGYREIFASYGTVSIENVLSGKPVLGLRRGGIWTPYHAWLLAHYFLFADPGPERSSQFQRYMTAVHQGVPLAEAATVFGDMRRLQVAVQRYVDRPTSFARTDAPTAVEPDPPVSTLAVSRGALIEARLELGTSDTAIDDAAVQRVRGRLGDAVVAESAEGQVLLAEAECRAAHADACIAAADRALALAPDDAGALAWKGMALLAQAGADTSVRDDRIAAARRLFERAIDSDGAAPLPRIGLFRSYAAAGQSAPDVVMRGMIKVVAMVPSAPAPRLQLARALMRQGQADVARRLLNPILNGDADATDRAAASRIMLAMATAPRSAP